MGEEHYRGPLESQLMQKDKTGHIQADGCRTLILIITRGGLPKDSTPGLQLG